MSAPVYDESTCLQSAAYHEAGHAVLLILFGQEIVRIQIRSDGAGHTESRGDLSVHQRIMVLQAGSACLDAFKISSVDTGGAERDYGEIVTLLDQHYPSSTEREKDAIEHQLRVRTSKLFEKPVIKASVEILANELINRKAMDGRRVHEIVNSIRFCCISINACGSEA